MEEQLNFGLSLLSLYTKDKFIIKDEDINARDDEVYIDKSKLKSCPNETQFINFMNKKINRIDMFKYQNIF